MNIFLEWHFYLAVLAALGTVGYLHWPKKKYQPPETHQIKFFGGPNDGKIIDVTQIQPFYVQPYIPKEPDDSQIVGQIGGQPLVMPSFAYYQRIDEENFFYSKDISQDKLENLRRESDQPS